jgi:hypothetical protein
MEKNFNGRGHREVVKKRRRSANIARNFEQSNINERLSQILEKHHRSAPSFEI